MMENGSFEHYIALVMAGTIAITFALTNRVQEAMTLIALILGYSFGAYKTRKKG